jgi:broad specificity phosphatase PhoE
MGAVSPQEVGDYRIGLSDRGKRQAEAAGQLLGRSFVHEALVYCSPYQRTRETLQGLLRGAGVPTDECRVFEDPRLREVEHGYGDVDQQEQLRQTHGWFYYRYQGGESPADCYDRTSAFLESLMRQADRKQARRALVVTHGLTIRCFVMRFLHLTVEQFETLANPVNCDVVTVGPKGGLGRPQFVSGAWGVEGLRLR